VGRPGPIGPKGHNEAIVVEVAVFGTRHLHRTDTHSFEGREHTRLVGGNVAQWERAGGGGGGLGRQRGCCRLDGPGNGVGPRGKKAGPGKEKRKRL
jgi:hypothetical protein